MARFTVDTHLFRELGELLVGRDSTALVELIKNSYDADATEVTVWGENLGTPTRGRILIKDNGVGMTEMLFREGFLRVASRLKEGGDRRSPLFKRRFTGAKGVGRLAAQKLAWKLSVFSVPNPKVLGRDVNAVRASIDWAQIEKFETLDDPGIDAAVSLKPDASIAEPGTEIELTSLRGKWTPAERSRVIHEVTTFQPPDILLGIPERVCRKKLLFQEIATRDVARKTQDPGFTIELTGDFEVGEEYWTAMAEAAEWILEIEADRAERSATFLITPTNSCVERLPNAAQHKFHSDSPKLESIPSLTARILIREGRPEGIGRTERRWLTNTAGVRIYMEGFRVLPYAEPGDDWLEIDFDYTRRSRALRFLSEADLDLRRFGDTDEDVGLSMLRNASYFGAVFLTRTGTPDLEMLVNREGFIPNASYLAMRDLIRIGIDLSVRVRAFENRPGREERRRKRVEDAVEKASAIPERFRVREAAEESASRATELAREARRAAAAGQHEKAGDLIKTAAHEIERSTGLAGELVSNRSIMQILAGVGLQMSAFVHEMNGLLGMATAIETAVASLKDRLKLDHDSRQELAKLQQSIGDLRRVVERQASYLADVTSPDARRRRSRQKLHERFDATVRLIERAAEKRRIEIENEIPEELKSPPMFPAELMVVFSNLLTNAIKACRRNGRVRATGSSRNGSVVIRLENTGQRVGLDDAEKWFLPFKSTTVEADPTLGQGMGMGLPIVRNILEEYGATIHFVAPAEEFATALEVSFR